MQLNWSTIVLEIVNFLILVWILKHFLYAPVLGVLARRRRDIEQASAQAKAQQEAAESLAAEYRQRLSEWEKEKESAQARLQQDMALQRARLLRELETGVERERRKTQVLERQRQQETLSRLENQALTLGARFAARLLGRFADGHLHARLCDLAQAELAKLPAERIASLRATSPQGTAVVRIESAYPLEPQQITALTTRLRELLNQEVNLTCSKQPTLEAGLRIVIGDWVLAANIEDELRAFAESAHEKG